jgi:hypothetical protein
MMMGETIYKNNIKLKKGNYVDGTSGRTITGSSQLIIFNYSVL